MNYYNEKDQIKADWLRNLIRAGLIPDGSVSEKDIRDVRTEGILGYTQCHFFAGIGGWSYALQLAGWPPGRPVWTASLPCQPFSSAGRQKGEKDDRHLWPVFAELIHKTKPRPKIIFGEQVASKSGREWLARVQVDLEDMGYTFGAADLCAASVSAPHRRQRLFWGAIRLGDAFESKLQTGEKTTTAVGQRSAISPDGSWLADPHEARWQTAGAGLEINTRSEPQQGCGNIVVACSPWDRYKTFKCRDGKTRRVPKSCVQPVAYGIPRSMGQGKPGLAGLAKSARGNRKIRIEGYGDSIVPQVAAVFVKSFMEAVTGDQINEEFNNQLAGG